MTANDIIAMTCHEEGFRVDDVISKPKVSKRVTLVRMAIARRLRGRGYSYPEISRALRLKNHSSAFWLVRGGKVPKHG